jgi:hypothetical protein
MYLESEVLRRYGRTHRPDLIGVRSIDEMPGLGLGM